MLRFIFVYTRPRVIIEHKRFYNSFKSYFYLFIYLIFFLHTYTFFILKLQIYGFDFWILFTRVKFRFISTLNIQKVSWILLLEETFLLPAHITYTTVKTSMNKRSSRKKHREKWLVFLFYITRYMRGLEVNWIFFHTQKRSYTIKPCEIKKNNNYDKCIILYVYIIICNTRLRRYTSVLYEYDN